ncbi:MAG: sulfatase-like hydrolase/transferase [Nitrospiraceae bacterium]|nr:sulfatase-like hydrolase/transferase [Nitrospiraceae bacterium]
MPEKPNILFIMTDQQRFDCLGANGNPLIQTPNLDKLAERSANLQGMFVQAPVCVPSRITFFTGRYPHSHRNRVNNTPLNGHEELMPKYLKDAGYATGVVGKLHFHPPAAGEARQRGFDIVHLHDSGRKCDEFSGYVKWRRINDPHTQIHYTDVVQDAADGENPYRSVLPDEFTETSWVGMQTRAVLEDLASADKPFFLFSSFFKPHEPFVVPAPFDDMYNDVEIPLPRETTIEEIRKLPEPVQVLALRGGPRSIEVRDRLQWMYRSYYGSVSHIDREVGLILDTLESTGQADNTIVIFVSDHGDQLREHGVAGKNVFFEASIRVPFLLSFGDRIQPGVYSQLVETTDVLPTVFELAGLDEPRHCQGQSFAPLVCDRGRPYEERDVVFCENIIPEVITAGRLDFRFEKRKGVGGIRHPDAKMVRSRRWKLNYYPGHGGELYDLENDPHEETNLYEDPRHADTVREMKDRLLDWMITSDETEQIAERWLI